MGQCQGVIRVWLSWLCWLTAFPGLNWIDDYHDYHQDDDDNNNNNDDDDDDEWEIWRKIRKRIWRKKIHMKNDNLKVII